MSLGSETGVKSRTGGVRGVLLAGVLPRRRPPPPPPGLNSRGALVQDVAARDPFPPGSRMTAVDRAAGAGLRSRVPATPAGGGGSRPPGCPGGHWRAAGRARGSAPQAGGLAPSSGGSGSGSIAQAGGEPVGSVSRWAGRGAGGAGGRGGAPGAAGSR